MLPMKRLPLVRKTISKIEVERKFLPSATLEALLKDNTNIQCAVIEDSLDLSTAPLTFNRHPNQVIHDTYFDLDSKLEAKGLWVRRRATRTVPSAIYPSVLPAIKEQWEAKVRIGGGYAKSEFVEIEGTEEVKEEISKHIPGTRLADLRVTADLETSRSSWAVEEKQSKHKDGAKTAPSTVVCIALDYIIEAGHPHVAVGGEEFHHFVGEVEMMGSAETDGLDEHEAVRRVTEQVSTVLDEFLARHRGLFLTHPEPMGKLGAFFTWKMARF